MNEPLTIECPAKVNLFLRVLAREADGYHGIETLFCRIALHDTLEISRTASGITLEVTGADGRGHARCAQACGRCRIGRQGSRGGRPPRLSLQLQTRPCSAVFTAQQQLLRWAAKTSPLLRCPCSGLGWWHTLEARRESARAGMRPRRIRFRA